MKKDSKRFAYTMNALSGARIAVAGLGLDTGIIALTAAIRYGAVRT